MAYRNELGSLAVLPDETSAECLVATVERVEGEQIVLKLGASRVTGRCAFSCLVVPRQGDTVAVVSDGEGRHYVTAILERVASGEVELFSRHSIAVRSASSVRLSAAAALELDGGERLRLKSPVLEAIVGRISAVAKAVCVTTGEALLQSRLARLCAELVDVAAQRIAVSAEHSSRHIEGTEQVRCRHFDLRATELAHVRAEAALVKAKSLLKMDASQIQIG